MNKEEAMSKIKDNLKRLMSFSTDEATETKEEMKYTTMKLKDGSEITIAEGSDLGVGTEVFKIDADGNQTPCEDGDYELEDGRNITIKGGLVEAIAEAKAEGEGAKDETPMNDAKNAEEKMAEEPKADEEKSTEGENPIEDRISSLENQITQILEILQGMGSMQEVAMSKIEAIAKAPATESIKIGKTMTNNNFNSVKSEMEELKQLTNKYKLNVNGSYGFSAAKTNIK